VWRTQHIILVPFSVWYLLSFSGQNFCCAFSSDMNYAFRNNHFERIDHLDINNRGFLYGDGFFDTMLILDGNPTFWEDRIDRAKQTLKYLQIEQNFSFDDMATSLKLLVREENHKAARARLTFIREGEGKYLPKANECRVYLSIENLNRNYFNESSAKQTNFSRMKVPIDRSGNFKLINKHHQVLAALEAKERELDDLIMVNTDDDVCETVSGNVYIINNDRVVTPPLTSGCLDGIIRRTLIKNQWCEEKSISISDARAAEAVFLTSSIAGVVQLRMQGQKHSKNQILEDVKNNLENLLISSARDLPENQQ